MVKNVIFEHTTHPILLILSMPIQYMHYTLLSYSKSLTSYLLWLPI